MLTCPYCQTQNSSQITLCVTCGSKLGSDELPSGTLLYGNTLEVQSVLGRGGFGIVYKALHLEKQKLVAVKELFPEGLASRGYNNQVQVSSQAEMQAAIARTSRETQMLRKLKHPSATKLFAYWEENSTAYMALELLEGQTLEERIQTGNLLSETEAVTAIISILEVLEELHNHGYLHRDIKPGNIILNANKTELIDFGSLTEFKIGKRIKVSSRILTPQYAPLEQYGSEVELAPATDLYALGVTFFEAMTGQRFPTAIERFQGASRDLARDKIWAASNVFGAVLERALELKISERYDNAQQMRQEIQSRILGFQQLASRTPQAQQNHPTKTALGVLAFLHLAFLSALLWFRNSDSLFFARVEASELAFHMLIPYIAWNILRFIPTPKWTFFYFMIFVVFMYEYQFLLDNNFFALFQFWLARQR